jgi:hypothetical protein
MKRTATFYSLTSGQKQQNDPSAEACRMRKSVSPRESVIRNLLNYSKALAVLNTNETGFINMVMN